MKTILVVDDEAGIRKTLGLILEDEGYRTLGAEDALVAFDMLMKEEVNVVFLDVLLPNMGGLEALEKIRKRHPDVEVVMISGHASVDMAVCAVKLGAFDFLEKPLSLDKALVTCRNALALQALRRENLSLKRNSGVQQEIIIGTSKWIEQVRKLVKQVAASDSRVLITGESGVGKDVIAQALHHYSGRKDAPFVEVNCASIPDALIESELFGHEKGAFTGAMSNRVGRFELADHGTLLLDEIGDMSQAAQAKVLRVIQEQKIEPLGGERSIPVDVRVIAATNKDLERECEAGRFRHDLFFRLNVIPIYMPPLREHADDVPGLLSHFLGKISSEKAASITFDESALQTLLSYKWPGNVRELKNLAERIVALSESDRVTGGTIAGLLQRPDGTPNGAREGELLSADIRALPYNKAKDAFEKEYLAWHYLKNGCVIAKTAEAIGVYPGNLHAKLKKYDITKK
ncbi:MAG: sigma-54 dependent transcriptional regulator [Treponema sp.]|jgi:two-component system nitrogen regulation response regulator NtrX|nr:sigma-54 dependent transcriptional regulator [Treponema sp.]